MSFSNPLLHLLIRNYTPEASEQLIHVVIIVVSMLSSLSPSPSSSTYTYHNYEGLRGFVLLLYPGSRGTWEAETGVEVIP